MKNKFAVSAALLFATSLALPASASTFNFTFAGSGVSGTFQLTYGSATDARYAQGYEVTGISGTFSDSNNGLNILNATIGALQPLTYSTPETGNLLAPHDFSRFVVATGLPPEDNGFLTYDNLFYPTGAPPTATDYPAFGAMFDIYGLMFNIGGGRVVDFWSNENFSGIGPFTYGVAVATSSSSLDYVATVTPEPSALGLLATATFGMLVGWKLFSARRLTKAS